MKKEGEFFSPKNEKWTDDDEENIKKLCFYTMISLKDCEEAYLKNNKDFIKALNHIRNNLDKYIK